MNNRQGAGKGMSSTNRKSSHKQSYHAFLESLKGKTVTIYRGGPESKSGILLDVKSDFVTLYSQNNNNNNNNNDNKNNNNNKNNNKNNNNNNNNDNNNNNQNTVVYYQAEHVKSISEDSKTNSIQVIPQTSTDEEETTEFIQADTFAELIDQLKNETIQINQGGPESKYGTLLGINNDFLHLFTEDDGIVYFNIHHIKSVSKYQQNNNNDNNENGGNNQQQQQTVVYPETVEASDFGGVFRHLEHKWVSINRGGPEAMEGVLVENSGGHYTLVSNEEVLRIHPYHIRSISMGAKGSMQNNNQNSDNNSENNNQNNENNNQNAEASSNSKDKQNSNDQSKSKETSRGSSRRERNSERVVKTIDYQWKF